MTADNMFNSPDGIKFDPSGLLWIQTDGNYSDAKDFAGMGHNQMLCADTESGEIRRFLVGPSACEITGLTWSDDRKTLFVGVQHPGEKGRGGTLSWRRRYNSTFQYYCGHPSRRPDDRLGKL